MKPRYFRLFCEAGRYIRSSAIILGTVYLIQLVRECQKPRRPELSELSLELLKVGADADITIFDPDSVRDNSTLDKGKNGAPSTGIPYVIVNGTVVVVNSKVLKGVYAGRPIRAAISS